MTEKERLLVVLARHTKVNAAHELVTPTGISTHSIIHALWDLQKQGLVQFRESYRGTVREATRIRLTEAGRAQARRLTAD